MRYTPVPVNDAAAMFRAAQDPAISLSDRLKLIASLTWQPQVFGNQDDVFQQVILEAADKLSGGPGDQFSPTVPPPTALPGPIAPNIPTWPPGTVDLDAKSLARSPVALLEALTAAKGCIFLHVPSKSLIIFGKDLPNDLLIDIHKKKPEIYSVFMEHIDPATMPADSETSTVQDAVTGLRTKLGIPDDFITYTMQT